MKRSNQILRSLFIVLIISSCKTYTIPVSSFERQMQNENSESLQNRTINNPMTYGNINYSSNNIDTLFVIDKTGNEVTLLNSPSIEMRITHVNGKKFHLYFDTVVLENDTLNGSGSRFISGYTRSIPIDSILKIEVQDGGKNFNYQQ